jgi:hypothetical protein
MTEVVGYLKMTPAQGGWTGEASVIGILTDLLLFSCLAAFTTGIVLAVASVLS